MIKKINEHNEISANENSIGIKDTEKIRLMLEALLKSGTKMTKEQILRFIEIIYRKIK
ncbi:MAG: hypothetical protein K2O36_05105 [Ruminococcus sp.]|nr:hypothetical protein [Ruminococcus sp.]